MVPQTRRGMVTEMTLITVIIPIIDVFQTMTTKTTTASMTITIIMTLTETKGITGTIGITERDIGVVLYAVIVVLDVDTEEAIQRSGLIGSPMVIVIMVVAVTVAALAVMPALADSTAMVEISVLAVVLEALKAVEEVVLVVIIITTRAVTVPVLVTVTVIHSNPLSTGRDWREFRRFRPKLRSVSTPVSGHTLGSARVVDNFNLKRAVTTEGRERGHIRKKKSRARGGKTITNKSLLSLGVSRFLGPESLNPNFRVKQFKNSGEGYGRPYFETKGEKGGGSLRME